MKVTIGYNFDLNEKEAIALKKILGDISTIYLNELGLDIEDSDKMRELWELLPDDEE